VAVPVLVDVKELIADAVELSVALELADSKELSVD
jgi:hypothetical protein